MNMTTFEEKMDKFENSKTAAAILLVVEIALSVGLLASLFTGDLVSATLFAAVLTLHRVQAIGRKMNA